MLEDLSPALVCPGAVFTKQPYVTATAATFKYQRHRLDPVREGGRLTCATAVVA